MILSRTAQSSVRCTRSLTTLKLTTRRPPQSHHRLFSPSRRLISTLKPNVLKNDPYIPIYAGLTTLAILATLTVYKNYIKTTATAAEVEVLRQELIDALHANYKSCLEQNKVSELMAPTLIHLCWSAASTYSRHDHRGGVGGATMRFTPESRYAANKGLERARAFIEPFKAAHPSMSYSDLWTLAAVVAIEVLGGPIVPWVSGRPDAEACDEAVTEARCPVANSGSIDADIDHMKVLFGRIGGLQYKHIVALFGAHSVGSCHENASGYSGTWTTDETTFSNEYFRLLLEEKWTHKKTHNGKKPQGREFQNAAGTLTMLPVDVALIHDPLFRASVEEYAADQKAFFEDFAYAFGKLINHGVEEQTVDRGYITRILGF
mmetsp:Transcript_24610/g.45858  ORF Transcript_24610/g.45858 Transcript_24610/m.45858 type:complete len:376 (+) Transcript_24610:65-1192(+)